MASSFEKHRTMIATAARSVQYTEFHFDVKAKEAVRWTTFTGIQKNRNKHFVFSVCLVLHWDLWLWVSPLISSSLTASLIEIMLSSAFSVTHTQKWDVSLPLQSVSVTGLTSGRASGHFTHFLSLSFSLSRFPPLSTHLSFGAQMEPLQAKEALAVHPTFSWRICCKAKKGGGGNINEKLCAVSSRVSS